MTAQNTGGPVDVAALISQAEKVSGEIGTAVHDLLNIRVGQVTSTEREQAAIREAAAAESAGVKLDAVDAMARTAANQDAAAWFGVNRDANTFILAGLGEELRSGVEDIRRRREDIIQRQSVGFFDNPLEWVINQVTVPFKQEALESRLDAVSTDMSVAQGLIARSTEMAGLNAAIVTTSAEAKALEAAKAIEARASIAAEQSSQRLATLGIQEINVRTALNRSQFDMMAATNNAIMAVQQIELSKRAADRADLELLYSGERLELARQQFQLAIEAEDRAKADEARKDARLELDIKASERDQARLELAVKNATNDDERLKLQKELQAVNITHTQLMDRLAERDDERKDKYMGIAVGQAIRDADRLALDQQRAALQEKVTNLDIEARGISLEAKKSLQDNLNHAAKVVGVTPPTVDMYNRMDARGKATWQRLMSDPNIMATGTLGANAGEAVQEISEYNWPLTPSMRYIYNKLDDIRSSVISEYSQATSPIQWRQLPKDAQANAINQAIKKAIETERKNIPDSGGIFSPPSAAAVIAIPAVAATELAKDLQPHAADPNNPLRANVVMAAAMLRVQKGEMTVETAAKEISTIYKSIMLDNNSTRQYNKFTIAGMAEGTTGYRTAITGPEMIGGTAIYGRKATIVDMSSEAALTAFLTRFHVQTLRTRDMSQQPFFGQGTTREQNVIVPNRGQ